MLHALMNWLRDPLGKRNIRQHNTYIGEMYAVKTLTQKANQKVLSARTPRVMGGANAIDRSVLGTYHHARKYRYEKGTH